MDKTEFIKYLESKDLALKTITQYVKYTGDFFAKVKKEDIQVVKPDVLKFMEYLKNRNLQKSYRSQYLNAINHYFTFLYHEGKITKNPCLFLKMRGVTKKKMYKIY